MDYASVGKVGCVLMAAFFATGGASPSCRLFDAFADFYNEKNASVSRLVVVTISDGEAFVRLLTLQDQHPIPGKPPMEWCRYEGFDQGYHYAISLNYPDELYRCRRQLVNTENLVREITQWEKRAVEERNVTTLNLPTSELSGVWLQQAKLDHSLIPAIEDADRQRQK